MKQDPTSIHRIETEARLERIGHLDKALRRAPRNSLRYRALRAAIRLEAGAYRKSLDVEQAMAIHDPIPGTRRASRSAPRH